ncbi:autotransporter outer membrane beta-barrel domain-containing protein [Akkermansia muciniphila]|uniref:autotransporter outer membrane beta-barrel domain-containing protein n=3 Tax=Akkermansia muciniphila TaxID=239935 RepID=UPI00122EEB08|nr:autotransporter outer membrane beta-barrel domain-containing protein [Akkermansia muciniphila]KAA3347426.1 autotransporter domain-containing protein [Akkermansia muciniphila]KAA3353140.1 autotransporter domain-containing protein [Akkermansia muciniphila]KAA3356992.1 autotransporter domain-containing protein [Akkermansia muciniphila]KAA3359091.1 autotransporter domain-containing protein [Akkermansia muciniphila]KAA3366591.1 autotransporter domain-containing protein [Akkermansia muciniphila]
MKLRLPLKLLSALLPFYAISGFHVFAATEWDGSRYSGNIYTWVGSSSNDFHNGGIVLTNPDGTYGPVNTNWGSVSEEGSIWNLFANETGLSQYNTLRFVASGTEVGDVTVSATNKNPSCSFTPFTMGGLIVEEGASGFSLVPNNNAQRTLILGRAGTEEPVLFTVREDFSLGSSSNAWGPVNVNADWNVLVANGKTLNVYGALNSSGRTITVGGEGFSGTLVLNNAANASMTAEWVITSGSTVRCMNNSALGSGLVTLDGGTLDFNSQTIGSTITLNMSGTGTLQNVTVDGAILSYTSSSGNDGITASNTTWTSGKIDIGRLLQGFSAEGSNTVDLGSNLGANFTVLGLDTGQYRIEGSVLTIEDEAISRVTWVSAGAGGTLEKTVKNAFTLALGEGSAANVSLGYLNGTLTTSGDKVYQITNTGGTKINLSGVYNSGATLPSGNLNYQGDIWMDINGGAFGIISGGVTNEWSTNLQTSTLTGDTHVQLSGNATAEHVIGGNNKGASTTLTGNTNVTVKDNAIVAGAIIGGSTSSHNAVTTITGNTSVLVTNIQHSNSATVNLGDFGNVTAQNFITGGSAWTANQTSGTTIQGNTSVTINVGDAELSGTEGHNNFVKNIYGGSYANTKSEGNGAVQKVEGNSSVSISGKEGITFTGDIMGGSFWNWGNGTTLTTNGNTSVSIDGGSTFTGKIVGGSWRGSTWTAEDPTALPVSIGGNITVTLGQGTYLGDIYGAGNCGTVGGDVLVSLTGGSVFGAEGEQSGITIGGSAGAAVEGNRTLELKGTFGTGDFQNVTFTRFDEINIAQEGSSATIWALTDSPSLTKTGAGTLTLGADAAGAETILDGTTEGITITEGSLNLSGAGGSHMKGTWNIASGSRLTGVSGTVTVGGENGLDSLSIALGTENIGQDTQASVAVISNGSGTGSDPNLSIEGKGLTLDLSNDAVVNLLLDHKTDDSSSYLTLTSGTLTVGNLGDIAFTTDLLSNYGIRITGTDGGSLVLSGAATGLYRVQEEGGNAHEVNSYQTLSGYAGVVIGGGQTLTVNLAGAPGEADGQGAKINNLMGATGSSLAVNNTGDGTAVVILNNKQMTTGEDDIDPAGQDTVMGGSITGGSNVTFIKEGTGTLTVGGTMDVETLALREGNIILNGTENSLDTLTLEGGGLTISGNAEIETITGTEAGGTLAIQGTLDLTGTSSINNGAITGTGSLRIREGAELALGGEARLDGTSVTADGTLTLTGTESGAISGLSGSGALSMNGGSLSISSATTSSGTFSGTLAGSGTLDISGQATQYLQTGNKDYDLAVRDGGVLVLKGTADAPTLNYNSITAGNNGTLRIEATGDAQGSANTTLNVENITFQNGSTTELIYNFNQDAPFGAPMLTAGTITVQDGAGFLLSNMKGNAAMNAGSDLHDVVLMSATGSISGLEDGQSLAARISGLFAVYYQDATLSRDGNDILLNATLRQENLFASAADTWNSAAGAGLLWEARKNLDPDSQLAQFMNGVSTMINDGNLSGASRAMAAAAGSTVNALGTAQRDALRDQMGWIRNRTTLMGVNPAYVNDDLPRFHMWMEGTGSYAKLDTRGDESGYQLTTWGGTVGVDADLSDRLTVGAAFTAGYGDLTASAADSADGHLDSYYASLFGRYQNKRWAHTLILTGGWNDAKLNRTVNYGEGSYGTQGSTSGWGFGAMYELTCDVYLDENRSSVLQPLFNASVVTTRMDGYEETGAGNAGLNVGRQDWTTGTLALGGRWMGLVGSNIFGREALAEIRVNAAQDLGDRRGETNVSLLGNPGFAQSVRGAKTGTTALQLGAGLSVPVGTKGTIYVNGNADIRDGSSSVNGSVGYRYDF